MRKTALLLLLCGSMGFADTLVLKDGSRHDGVLESTNDQYIVFNEGGGMSHRYSRSEVRAVEFNDANLPNSSDRYGNSRDDRDHRDNSYGSNTNASDRNRSYNNGPLNGRNSVTVPAGTEIAVRTDQSIDSQSANEGQLYPAEVEQDVADASGNIVIPKGSQAELTIRSVNGGGGVTGSSEVALGLDSVNVNGNSYRVSTQDVQQQGNSGIGKNKRTAEMVGGGAVLGTLIGAIAGGGKGAAIGAIAGAGAGAGAQVLTRGKAVKVPAETTLRFRLDQSLDLQPN